MELLNSAAYCCNQATSMDENQLNEIYARKLHDYNNNSNNQHKVEEILLEFLASNTDKYDRTVREIFNCFSYYEKSKKMPEECNELRIVNVGNKSTRKPESIDYSTMPLVTNTATLPDKVIIRNMIALGGSLSLRFFIIKFQLIFVYRRNYSKVPE